MSKLSPQAMDLLELVRGAEEPSVQDKARVRRRLAAKLAAGVAAGAVVGTVAHAASGSVGAGTTAGVGAAAATGGAAGVAAGATAGASGAAVVSGVLVAKFVAVGVVIGAVGVGAVHVATHPKPVPQTAAVVVSSQAMRKPVVKAKVSPPPKVSAPQAVETDVEHEPATRGVPSARRRGTGLGDELHKLQKAHRALSRGQADKAVDLLDQDAAAESQRGQLDEERAAMRVFALCRAGKVEQARRAAANFARRWPGSLYVDKVKSACANQ